jgi:predicted anti-sigma-YlaC factor YlaD
MTCKDFNERLYDYLDGGLSPGLEAAAREHLGECSRCRLALRREEAVAQSIGHALDQATTGLSLRPSTVRNLFRAEEAVRGGTWIRLWKWFVSVRLRPAGTSVALVAVLSVLLGLQTHRRGTEGSRAQTTESLRPELCVVDVPIQTRSHVFRRQNETVVDAMAPGVAIGRAHFKLHNVPSLKPL